MRHRDTSHSLLAASIEIPAWLEQDRATPHDERIHRDRMLGKECRAKNDRVKVRQWWQNLRQRSDFADTQPATATRAVSVRRFLTLSMLLAGVLGGVAGSSAVLHYDGTWPVNVVTAFAALVLLQALLIVLTLVLMLPHVPGLRAIQELIAGLNPGTLATTLFKRMTAAKAGEGEVLAWHPARGPAVKRFLRWQVLVWSQTAAVAFNLAAIATALVLVTFTDLAFGWSTTLRVNQAQVLHITQSIAAPWSELWPDAVPDATLVEQSRFFRLSSAPPPNIAASDLTGWWPFLLASLVTYALIPRVCLLLFATFRLRAATRRLLLDDPRVRALLDRMAAAEIRLGPQQVETAREFTAEQVDAAPASTDPAFAIIWSGSIAPEAVAEWAGRVSGRRVSDIADAGSQALAADEHVIERAAAAGSRVILIFVRAWEAPLLDLQDFITALRARVGERCSLVIVPVGPQQAPASEEQRVTWSRWAARVRDPGLYLESGH